jgi:hypothetical protein
VTLHLDIRKGIAFVVPGSIEEAAANEDKPLIYCPLH